MADDIEADAELHARIAQVQDEIDQHTEALRALEWSKSDIQRHLNNRTDPIALLPSEISSKIFLHCVPPLGTFGKLSQPLLFLRICTLWTEIALSTHRLWSNLHIDIPQEPTAEFIEFLAGWLARGKDYPLSLSFAGPPKNSPHDEPLTDPEILRIVALHAYRMRNLEIQPHCYLSIFAPNGTTFPILESFRVHETLITDERWGHHVNLTLICDLLDAAPRLKKLVVDPAHFNPLSAAARAHTHHPALTHCQLDNLERPTMHLLPLLTLPALTHLSVALYRERNQDPLGGLTEFLRRSSAPLERLSIVQRGNDIWRRDAIERLFATTPHLIALHVTLLPAVRDLTMAILMHPHFLPSLAELTITLSHPWPDRTWYTTLAEFLGVRSGGLKSFVLDFKPVRDPYLPQINPEPPFDGDKEVFRRLMKQGMQLDLGRIATFVEEPEA
ncbi:hypothetical protein R3P38DRAFT_3296626 [Favolaschia claudopus]|uniref:F-box domain-containing protein n=1 Tax=Favolaschia claudopus TaxID=2862362 RepID=A0AAV9Z8Y9_9AGAR